MMRALLVLYLILTCPEPLYVQFPTPITHEEAGESVPHDEGARSPSSQDSTDRCYSVRSRCHSLDDAAADGGGEGPPRTDGHEPVDEELRSHGVHFEDQGRSRPSTPEGYPWPLSLAAETADPATLRRVSVGGSLSTSRAGVSS